MKWQLVSKWRSVSGISRRVDACNRSTSRSTTNEPIELNGFDPDLLGIYAGVDNFGKNLTLVVVNKDPSNQVSFNLLGLPIGNYFVRHFGGQAGVAKFQVCLFETSIAELADQ